MDFKLVPSFRSFRRNDTLMMDSPVIKILLQYKSNTFHNSAPSSVQIIRLSMSEVMVHEIPYTPQNLGQPQQLIPPPRDLTKALLSLVIVHLLNLSRSEIKSFGFWFGFTLHSIMKQREKTIKQTTKKKLSEGLRMSMETFSVQKR